TAEISVGGISTVSQYAHLRSGYRSVFFFSSRRRHTRFSRDWSSDVCSSDLDGRYRVAMGIPCFDPASVPLLGFDAPRERYVIAAGGSILEVGAVSMGNPHVVLEVEEIDVADVGVLGPRVQGYGGLPDSANVGFVQLLAPNRIRLRVYERGVGETRACGSGACAAVAVLVRRGSAARE